MQRRVSPSLVLYHYPCLDGAFAALAAFQAARRDGVDMVLLPHRTDQPVDLRTLRDRYPALEDLYLLDYCGPTSDGGRFMAIASDFFAHVYLLDHHKTAADVYGNGRVFGPNMSNLHVTLDMQHSGCTLAAAHFGVPVTRLMSYVEDNDLWRHVLPRSKECTAGLQSLNMELDCTLNPGIWHQLEQLDVDTLIDRGVLLLEERARIVADLVENHTYPVLVPGASLMLLAADLRPDQWALKSDLGHALAVRNRGCGVGAVCVVDPNAGTCNVSLRSTDQGADTTLISSLFGGGGHRNASGFTVAADTWNGWRVK